MPPRSPRPDPEALAIAALTFLAGDPERIGRFLSLTGIAPSGLRAAAGEPLFLVSVLDHLMADESLLMAFSAQAGFAPETVAQARYALAPMD